MATNDISLDKAELLSVLLEALFYGFSLFLFGLTISVQRSRSSSQQVSRRILSVACLLFLFSTVHIVVDIIRIIEGLILLRDTYPEGSIGYFSNASQWTFVCKNCVYNAQTVLGDGVILYRCYTAWQSKLVMVLPVFLLCTVVVTGVGTPYILSHEGQGSVFDRGPSAWITSFFVSTLTTNLFTTLLLAYRIWSVDRGVTRLGGHGKSQLRTILQIVIDSGAIYSITLLVMLTCFVSRTNGQYLLLDMVTPIISITFYLVIIRVGLVDHANRSSHSLIPGHTSACGGQDGRGRLQVHITTLTEGKAESDPRSLTGPMIPMISMVGEGKDLGKIELDGVGEAV